MAIRRLKIPILQDEIDIDTDAEYEPVGQIENNREISEGGRRGREVPSQSLDGSLSRERYYHLMRHQ